MANVGINLLKNRRVLSERDYQREAQYFRYSLVALILVIVVAISMSLWNFYLSRRLAEIDTTISKASKSLAGLAQANARQVYLKSRLELITSFLDSRSVAREAIQQVFTLAIPGADVTGVYFENEKVLGVQVTSLSVIPLKQVIDYYSTDNDFFTQVVSDSISRAQDGSYRLQMHLTLPGTSTEGKNV